MNYLLPHRYKKLGWFLFVPTLLLGILMITYNWTPEWLNLQVPAFFTSSIGGEDHFFAIIENNVLNEIVGILFIISALIIAFTKEKTEDEFIQKIRLESLVWAVYANYGILILLILFIYDITFFWVMIFNMFTILIFFIIRFNYKLARLKHVNNEE